jgi:hypothetical protein
MNNFIIFGIIFILAGIYLTPFGSYFKYPAYFFLGVISWIIIGIIIVFSIFGSLTRGANSVHLIIVLSVSTVLGIAWSFLMFKFEKIFQINLGAVLGLLIGQFAYNLIFTFLAPLPVIFNLK